MADNLITTVCCFGVLLGSALGEIELFLGEDGIGRVSRACYLAAIGAVAQGLQC